VLEQVWANAQPGRQAAAQNEALRVFSAVSAFGQTGHWSDTAEGPSSDPKRTLLPSEIPFTV